MADDSFSRSYRSSEPARRAGVPAAARDSARDASGDPLAELARLIGQNDPFTTDPGRNSGHPNEGRARGAAPPSDWRKTAAAIARESMRDPPAADARYEQVDSAIAATRSLRPPPHEQFAQAGPRPNFDQAAQRSNFDQAAHAPGDYADSPYDDEPHMDDAGSDDRYDNSRRAERQQDGYDNEGENENYFFDGADEPADDRFYDDPPRSRASNGLLTVAVLVGCGILGTAGAYGYRTFYSGVHPTDAPIISAEKSPSKMVPASAGADSSKSIQERLGERTANERVVGRQEEPVTLSDANAARAALPAPFTTSPGSGPSFPPGPAVGSAPPAQSNASVQQSSGPSGAPSEPKKVRTVAIRPDGADPTARSASAGGSPPQTAPSPAVATTRQPPASKPASQASSASPAARNGGSGPLSLEPQGQMADTASSYQSVREHATPAPTPASAPASGPRLASVSATAAGGYVVQVSSQRSEADAQASFHSLQTKFPKTLGDRDAMVRRADLGTKGVYYRAMVGPFGSAGEADQFCNGLKADGGQCIVQKN
jgi:SPOR domain